jgi:hypothetical protein
MQVHPRKAKIRPVQRYESRNFDSSPLDMAKEISENAYADKSFSFVSQGGENKLIRL